VGQDDRAGGAEAEHERQEQHEQASHPRLLSG
jgi:hypothetical protein